jgi:transposase
MGRGKQINDRLKELVLMELATNNNLRQVAEIFGISAATVKKIRDEKPDEFEQLRAQKKVDLIDDAAEWKKEFLTRAEQSINKAVGLSSQMIEQAETGEVKIPLRDLAVFIGTLYDKRALSSGGATTRGEVTGKDGGPIEQVIEVTLTDED